MPGLRVVARTSSFSFKGRTASAAEIARELNVAHLLEGSVRRPGAGYASRRSSSAPRDSSHVWSQSFDRDLSDIFAVQDEIAAAVVGELEVKLFGGAAPKAQPTDPRAYALYLQGRHFFSLYSATGYEQAIAALDAALAIDPGFGPAWAMLGACTGARRTIRSSLTRKAPARRGLASEKALVARSGPGRADVAARPARRDREPRRRRRPAAHRARAASSSRTTSACCRGPRTSRRQRGRIEEAIRYAEQALSAGSAEPERARGARPHVLLCRRLGRRRGDAPQGCSR